MSAEVTSAPASAIDAPHRPPRSRPAWHLILKNPIGALGGVIVAVVVVMAALAGVLAPFDPTSQLAQPLQPPGGAYPLGTDEFGRDVLSRVIHGARVSLWVGIISVSIALISGSILGLLAGYYGG